MNFHTHSASSIIRGVLASARLGSGTASTNTFLRGDSTWKIPPLFVPIGFGTTNPGDGATVYGGNHFSRGLITTAYVQKVRVLRPGTITAAYLHTYGNTAGSNENWSVYIRLNDTTDTLIETIGASTNERIFDNTGLSIAVVVGDFFEIKFVNPTWGTNPASVTGSGFVVIE